MVRKVSLELEQEICEQYWTAKAKELGEKYGIKPNTIKGIWQRNGYTGKSSFTPDVDEFTRLYNEMQIQEVALHYKKDRHTITKFAKKIGIYKEPVLLLTEQQKEEICSKYQDALARELAEQYGVSISRIYQVWAQNGLIGKNYLKYHFNENYFHVIDCEHKAYWVGFLMSDGCIYERKRGENGIRLTLNRNDEDIILKFREDIGSEKPLYHSSSTRKTGTVVHSSSLDLISDIMYNDLLNIGLSPRKTYDVPFPEFDNKELYKAYFRGYFDGDGSISKNFFINTLSKVSVNISGFENNLRNMQKFLEKEANIKSSIYIEGRTPNFGSLNFTNKGTKCAFLHYIYDDATIYLSRKYILAQKFFDLCQRNPRTKRTS